ncbi:MAG: hypothetical protein D6772_08420 [Bacteroidetes bacterium]|nr:MAG: hypothetical protein D6772_08420 [Bacteroidota bacterium]
MLTSIVWLWFTGFVVSNSIKGLRSGVPLDGGMTVVILITILVGLIMAFSPKTFLKPITRGILSFMKFENEVGQQIDDFNRASPVDLVRKRPGY